MSYKITEILKIDQGLAPVDITEEKTSPFLAMNEFRRIVILVNTGKVDSGKKVTVQLMQAKDAAGAEAKPMGNPVEKTVEEATGEMVHMVLESHVSEMEEGYSHLGVKLGTNNPAGVTGAVEILRGEPRYYPVE